MNINFYSKNYEIGEEVKSYIEEKMNKFLKFSKDNISADIKIERSKHQNSLDVFTLRISLSIDGHDFTVEKTGSTAFEATDKVEEALESMIVKNKDQRISSRKNEGLNENFEIEDLNID
jgi:ribosomal subunit interface protein